MHLESLQRCIRRVCAECFQPQPFVKCTKCIKDEGEVLLVVNQQGEGDKTLVEENGNGSGHI